MNKIINYEFHANINEKHSIIYDCVFNFLTNKTNEDDMIKYVFSKYNSQKKSMAIYDYYGCLTKYKDIKLESDKDPFIAINPFIKDLYAKEDAFVCNTTYSALKNISESFFAMCKQVIFNPHNCNLLDESFRQSGFVKELLYPLSENNRKQLFYEYFLNDPFLATILIHMVDTVKNIAPVENIHLHYLKSYLLSNFSEKYFNRSLNINNTSYCLSLDKDNSQFVAAPRQFLSSINSINPIHFVEKIISFINRKINSCTNKTIPLNICVLGKVDDIFGSKLAYTVTTVLKHFNRNNLEHKLELKIFNLVNNREECYCGSDNSDDVIEKSFDYEGSRGYYLIKKYDYNTKLYFSTCYLCDLIKMNDMLFIVDCPWLTNDDFELGKTVSINYFCKELQDISFEQFLSSFDIINTLDTQFNRLMSSDTVDSGRILRIIKDNIPRRIERTLNSINDEDKDVYLFLSNPTAINYSYLNYYPLQKIEIYDGDMFYVFKFCNYKLPVLSNNPENKIDFKINLWAIFKRLPFDYSLKYLKDIIKTELKINEIERCECIDLYNNIYLQITADKINNIKINILFNSKFENYLSNEQNNTLFNTLGNIIIPLIKDILFKSEQESKNTCTSYLQYVFSSILYDHANTEYEIYVWHMYRKAVQSNDFRAFKKIEFGDTFSYLTTIKQRDPFKNKWIYDIMFKHLEKSDEVTINQSYIINSVSYNFFEDNCSDKQFVTQIINICKAMSNSSNMLTNCKKAFSSL